MLIDKAIIQVKAGKGGNGCESYYKPSPYKAIPNGGSGGRGGDIIIKADSNISDLEYFKFNKHIKGNDGAQGSSNNKTGRCGKPVILHVPIGTKIINLADNCLIRDLVQDGEEVIVAIGGRGGFGNCEHKNRTMGEVGEEFEISLDFLLKSDISFIGEPNSGKSSLLGVLTRAKVKIMDYPFSTTAPQLGSYEFEDYSRITICDLPSLVAGASDGKGMGNYFLKHLQRTKLIFLIIASDNGFSSNILNAFDNLQMELNAYDKELLNKEKFIIINKTDLDFSEENTECINTLKIKYGNVYLVSAKTKEGLDNLMQDVYEKIKRV